jgi:hypothetical protein
MNSPDACYCQLSGQEDKSELPEPDLITIA